LSWQPHSELNPNYLARQIIAFDQCGQSLLLNTVSGNDSRNIFISHDGGQTYRTVLNASAKGESLWFPSDTSSIICVTSNPFGIWISNNRGETWEKRSTSYISRDSLRVCSLHGLKYLNHTRLIVGCSPPKLLISDDTGRTFKILEIGHPNSDGELPQIANGAIEGELYACVAFSNRAGEGGIYRSDDFGSSWRRMPSPSSAWCHASESLPWW
jgi:hypothetical protein